jgi:hypothetical protein
MENFIALRESVFFAPKLARSFISKKNKNLGQNMTSF